MPDSHADAGDFTVAMLLCILCSGCASDDMAREDSGQAGANAGATFAAGTGGSISPTGGASAGGSGGAPTGTGAAAGTGAISGSAGTGGSAQGGTSSGPGGPVTCDAIDSNAVAPSAAWANATGNLDLASMDSTCANVAKIGAVPCSKQVIANVLHRGLFITDDDGASFQALGTAAGGQVIQNYGEAIVFDPETPSVFWEAGIHDGPGLFRTTDGGASFEPLGTVTFAQLVSVDFSDPERKTLLTGHHSQKVTFLSTDSGATWTDIFANFPSGVAYTEGPLVLDANTFLMGVQDCGAGTCGIYRSTNKGADWSSVSDMGVGHYGGPLWASDGSIYWPLGVNSGMAKSTDLGLTWSKIIDTGTIYAVSPVELPDHSIVTVGTDHLIRTTDGGANWSPIGQPLPFATESSTLTYAAATKTFFFSHSDCSNVVPSDAIVKAGFDYTAN